MMIMLVYGIQFSINTSIQDDNNGSNANDGNLNYDDNGKIHECLKQFIK